jgi:hypothetical protein
VEVVAAGVAPYASIYFRTNGINAAPAVRMTVDYTGKVGIGTTTPDAGSILDVEGTASSGQIEWGSGGGRGALYGDAAQVGIGSATNQKLIFWTNNSAAQMTLSTAGFLGVGVTAPAYALDVTGDVNCSGNFRKSGAIISGGVTTQNLVAGSRALGGVYQNTTGKPMWVAAGMTLPTGQVGYAYTDSSTSPSAQVGGFNNGGANAAQYTLGFWVLSGNYYKVTGTGSASLTTWIEWW